MTDVGRRTKIHNDIALRVYDEGGHFVGLAYCTTDGLIDSETKKQLTSEY
jgi:hypothetical protein